MGAILTKKLTSMEEADLLDRVFSEQYRWYRPGEYFRNCLIENISGSRITLIAYYEGQLAGCCHLLINSQYPFFKDHQIPEINDLNVFPEFRRKKIASAMFDELEIIAATSSRFIGLGVGLYKDYGHAQKMYTSRGYVMDGNGITYKNVPVEPGNSVMVDDDLLLYLIKDLEGNL
ncbi:MULTISPECIES: GNAT family N-acetyltransferase [Paenibacillus]|uniref:GNAT family N-acetyltransferase n=1 Tax=Paenibacillus TaxID=44249 RepID=UPI0009E80993|nr:MULTISPECIES: GNAT family N-acetyltransferase [Paenibacillus]MDU4696492.1 GNAT family N-acetyltransferase [Paenibacillus sp.]